MNLLNPLLVHLLALLQVHQAVLPVAHQAAHQVVHQVVHQVAHQVMLHQVMLYQAHLAVHQIQLIVIVMIMELNNLLIQLVVLVLQVNQVLPAHLAQMKKDVIVKNHQAAVLQVQIVKAMIKQVIYLTQYLENNQVHPHHLAVLAQVHQAHHHRIQVVDAAEVQKEMNYSIIYLVTHLLANLHSHQVQALQVLLAQVLDVDVKDQAVQVNYSIAYLERVIHLRHRHPLAQVALHQVPVQVLRSADVNLI